MAIFIVISAENKAKLMALKEQFQNEIDGFKSDIHPVELLSGEFILPLSVLEDEAFQAMKARIIADGNESLIVTRHVDPSEFIPPPTLPGM